MLSVLTGRTVNIWGTGIFFREDKIFGIDIEAHTTFCNWNSLLFIHLSELLLFQLIRPSLNLLYNLKRCRLYHSVRLFISLKAMIANISWEFNVFRCFRDVRERWWGLMIEMLINLNFLLIFSITNAGFWRWSVIWRELMIGRGLIVWFSHTLWTFLQVIFLWWSLLWYVWQWPFLIWLFIQWSNLIHFWFAWFILVNFTRLNCRINVLITARTLWRIKKMRIFFLHHVQAFPFQLFKLFFLLQKLQFPSFHFL